MIHFSEKNKLLSKWAWPSEAEPQEVGCMQGSVAVACGLSLWSEVARKSDTQQEPPLAGTASSKQGPPFLGCS